MMAKYFGTNGVRGKFDMLTPELALELAKAIGTYFKRGRPENPAKILVARDGRLTGECLKHAVISGLASVGCSVVDLDYASAPTAEFMLKELGADGLIIITASHNPPEWNALKVVDGKGATISHERGEQIEKLIGKTGNAKWNEVKRSEGYIHSTTEHVNAIKRFLDKDKIRKRKPKLVLDCGNGMAALIAPRLFKELGCLVVLLNEEIDGRFPGRPSEPTEANVSVLKKAVQKEKADAGIAWDGDGDRVIFVDENGAFVVGDKVFALSVLLKLGEENGAVVTTVATSKAAEDIARENKARVVYTKIGAPYLSEKMLEISGLIGGEEVGGVIWPEISLAKDGFFTAAKIVEALSEKKLSEWIAELPKYFNEKTKIECNDEQKKRIIDGMKKYADNAKTRDPGLKTNSIDGIRIDFEDASWVIVRASGTEAYVRIFAEAKTLEKAKELVSEYKKIAEGFRGTD